MTTKEHPCATPVVLLGCGAISQAFYTRAFRVLAPRGELAVHSLVDPLVSARSVVAEAFPGAMVANRLAEVEAPAGSLVVIATPPRFHAEHTAEALARGWHVLCEKPMASTTAECEKMISAAEKAKLILAVGLYKRFFPSSRAIKDLVSGGQLGKLKKFTISEGGPFKWPAATPSFFNKAQTPGGVLLDVGVHVLDLLTWWLGEPKSIDYADDAMGGLEINARLKLSYPGGISGSVHLSRDWLTANEYRFEFQRGIVSWKVNDANHLLVQPAGTSAAYASELVAPLSDLSDPSPQRPLASNPQSFIAQLQNVLRAIEGTEALLVPGAEGIRSLRLIETCYQNRTLLEQPWLSPEEATRARELAQLS